MQFKSELRYKLARSELSRGVKWSLLTLNKDSFMSHIPDSYKP